MPWNVLPEIEQLRKRLRESSERGQGSCRDGVDAVILQASALLRRRGSEDTTMVATLITGAPHCVPCISLITHLDARRIYAALERLKAEAQVRVASGTCRRCARTTTVNWIGE